MCVCSDSIHPSIHPSDLLFDKGVWPPERGEFLQVPFLQAACERPFDTHSLQSFTPSGPMANCASLSARQGDEMILTILFSPLPFLNHSLVVVPALAAALVYWLRCLEGERRAYRSSSLLRASWS